LSYSYTPLKTTICHTPTIIFNSLVSFTPILHPTQWSIEITFLVGYDAIEFMNLHMWCKMNVFCIMHSCKKENFCVTLLVNDCRDIIFRVRYKTLCCLNITLSQTLWKSSNLVTQNSTIMKYQYSEKERK